MTDEGTKKKATAKKSTRSATGSTRKRTSRKGATPYARVSARKQATRKAPTHTPQSKPSRARNSTAFKVISVGIGLLAVSVGASVYVGMSGGGQINVASTINQTLSERNERQNNTGDNQSETNTTYTPTRNNPPTVPNGGLRPARVQTPQQTEPIAPQSTTTQTGATTTSATTTEESTEDNAIIEEEFGSEGVGNEQGDE